jgi:hypothetical protein
MSDVASIARRISIVPRRRRLHGQKRWRQTAQGIGWMALVERLVGWGGTGPRGLADVLPNTCPAAQTACIVLGAVIEVPMINFPFAIL